MFRLSHDRSIGFSNGFDVKSAFKIFMSVSICRLDLLLTIF